jgi:hypothetical protein
VLELRTLPLRQHEEDEMLAAEAHVDGGTRRVMTENFRPAAGDADPLADREELR